MEWALEGISCGGGLVHALGRRAVGFLSAALFVACHCRVSWSQEASSKQRDRTSTNTKRKTDLRVKCVSDVCEAGPVRSRRGKARPPDGVAGCLAAWPPGFPAARQPSSHIPGLLPCLRSRPSLRLLAQAGAEICVAACNGKG